MCVCVCVVWCVCVWCVCVCVCGVCGKTVTLQLSEKEYLCSTFVMNSAFERMGTLKVLITFN